MAWFAVLGTVFRYVCGIDLLAGVEVDRYGGTRMSITHLYDQIAATRRLGRRQHVAARDDSAHEEGKERDGPQLSSRMLHPG